MKKRLLVILCCVTLTAGMLVTGCGSTDTTTQTDAEKSEDSAASDDVAQSGTEQDAAEQGDSVFGQITAIDGDTITIALAEQPQMQDGKNFGDRENASSTEMPADGEGMPSTEMGDRPQMPADGENMPSTEMGDRPQMPADGESVPSTEMGETSDEFQKGGMNLTLTGEEQTITIDANTTITVNGETATAADLAVDDTVTVTMDGDTVVSISSGMGKRTK